VLDGRLFGGLDVDRDIDLGRDLVENRVGDYEADNGSRSDHNLTVDADLGGAYLGNEVGEHCVSFQEG
jgi:hypothetical protein